MLNKTKAQLKISPISKAKLLTDYPTPKPARKQISDPRGRTAGVRREPGRPLSCVPAGAKARALVPRTGSPNRRLKTIHKSNPRSCRKGAFLLSVVTLPQVPGTVPSTLRAQLSAPRASPGSPLHRSCQQHGADGAGVGVAVPGAPGQRATHQCG